MIAKALGLYTLCYFIFLELRGDVRARIVKIKIPVEYTADTTRKSVRDDISISDWLYVQ